jgi:acyl-CoA thioesterase
MNRFDRDTALVATEPHRYEGSIDHGWWVELGPNGGYVAAIILRALTMEVAAGQVGDAPVRSPRSLTIHYLAPPAEGPVAVTATIERQGGRITFVSARMTQGDRTLASAMAAFSIEFSGPEFHDLHMPDVPPPDLVLPWESNGPAIELRDRYEMLQCVGAPPFTKAPTAVSGGWIRLTDRRPAHRRLDPAGVFAHGSPSGRADGGPHDSLPSAVAAHHDGRRFVVPECVPLASSGAWLH